MLVDERMLLQRDFATHDKMSLGAPIVDWPSLKTDGISHPELGHNEHLLHHRCGGRDHSRRRLSGPARIGKAGKPFPDVTMLVI
jgi:hypothetical protein